MINRVKIVFGILGLVSMLIKYVLNPRVIIDTDVFEKTIEAVFILSFVIVFILSIFFSKKKLEK
jgi:hypothetical protein